MGTRSSPCGTGLLRSSSLATNTTSIPSLSTCGVLVRSLLRWSTRKPSSLLIQKSLSSTKSSAFWELQQRPCGLAAPSTQTGSAHSLSSRPRHGNRSAQGHAHIRPIKAYSRQGFAQPSVLQWPRVSSLAVLPMSTDASHRVPLGTNSDLQASCTIIHSRIFSHKPADKNKIQLHLKK